VASVPSIGTGERAVRSGPISMAPRQAGRPHSGTARGIRVVIPVWDCTLGELVACLDTTLRRIGGSPTYAPTDNAKTVTVEQ
jgi:hypothetical protein